VLRIGSVGQRSYDSLPGMGLDRNRYDLKLNTRPLEASYNLPYVQST
jgi:hypothetical protein